MYIRVNYKCCAWYKVTIWWPGVVRSHMIATSAIIIKMTIHILNAGYDYYDRLFKIILPSTYSTYTWRHACVIDCLYLHVRLQLLIHSPSIKCICAWLLSFLSFPPPCLSPFFSRSLHNYIPFLPLIPFAAGSPFPIFCTSSIPLLSNNPYSP